MNERAPTHSPEHGHSPHEQEQARELEAAARERLEQAAAAHERPAAHEVHKIEEKVEKRAHSSEEIRRKVEHAAHDTDSQKTYNYTSPQSIPHAITQARRQLKPVDRALSKVIHNPKVDTVSTIGGATVARPSGLLYGSLFSLIASVGFYAVSKKYGYDYNAFIGILAFVGGFFFGLLIEMLTAAFRPASK